MAAPTVPPNANQQERDQLKRGCVKLNKEINDLRQRQILSNQHMQEIMTRYGDLKARKAALEHSYNNLRNLRKDTQQQAPAAQTAAMAAAATIAPAAQTAATAIAARAETAEARGRKSKRSCPSSHQSSGRPSKKK
jgi:chromosome segregation ATPase